MSFSTEVKRELMEAAAEQLPCCAEAQLYGMLLFARDFSPRGIRFTTESAALAELFCALLLRFTPAAAELRRSGRKWEAEINNPGDCVQVLEHFGHAPGEVTLRINRMNFSGECCPAAFLRGAFLACAAVTAPQRQYHLEFSVSFRRLAGDLAEQLGESGLTPGVTQRKGVWLLYFKGSEQIEDTLALLGAQRASLDLMGVKIEKDVRNHVNRRVNFETANMNRTAGAAATQLESIRNLRETGAFAALPEPLRQAAALREENPEASLQELCDLCGGGVTRSGMNHRLKRLVEMAGE
ncbi:MAG: DNA-binding protein WhiA [Oscillospiraceae bacterium]|nr:DNA-binding protein WhiA [Oscillospiraceae bacterium]